MTIAYAVRINAGASGALRRFGDCAQFGHHCKISHAARVQIFFCTRKACISRLAIRFAVPNGWTDGEICKEARDMLRRILFPVTASCGSAVATRRASLNKLFVRRDPRADVAHASPYWCAFNGPYNCAPSFVVSFASCLSFLVYPMAARTQHSQWRSVIVRCV